MNALLRSALPWSLQRDAKSAVLPAIVIEADYKLIESNGRIKNESCAKLGTIARESPSTTSIEVHLGPEFGRRQTHLSITTAAAYPQPD